MCDNVIDVYFGVVGQVDQGVGWQEVLCWYVGIWQQQVFVCGIDQFYGWMDVFVGSWMVFWIYYFDVGQVGQFVGLMFDGDVFFYVYEGYGIVYFGDDWVGVWVLFGDDSVWVDFVIFFD